MSVATATQDVQPVSTVSESVLSSAKVVSSASLSSTKPKAAKSSVKASAKKTAAAPAASKRDHPPKRAASQAKPKSTVMCAPGSKAKSVKAIVSKPKGEHPPYLNMVTEAISSLKDRKGSTIEAVFKYIMEHYPLGDHVTIIRKNMKSAIKRGVADGSIVASSEQAGLRGRFRVVKPLKKAAKAKKETADGESKPKKKSTAKAKKTATPKKPVAKKAKTTVAKTAKPTASAASQKKTTAKPAEKSIKSAAKSKKASAKAPTKKTAVAKSPKKSVKKAKAVIAPPKSAPTSQKA